MTPALEAERALMGSVFLQNVLMDEAAVLLSPAMFSPGHRPIFGAMLWLRENNQPIDPVVISHMLRVDGVKSKESELGYMSGLMHGLPRTSSVKHWARLIKDTWVLRSAVEQLEYFKECAEAGDYDPDSLLGMVEEKFASMRERSAHEGQKGGILAELRPEFDAYLKLIESGENPAIPTGIATLDHVLNGGLMPGALYGLVGRSGEGKSLLMKQWLQSTAKRGVHGIMFSLEMSSLQNTLRWISAGSGVPLHHFSWGMTPNDMGRARDREDDLFKLPIHVYNDCRTVPDIWKRAKEVMRRYPVGWIAIDHFHLLSRGKARQENRTTDLEWMANQAKEMAMELNIPIVMPGQLDKEGTKREHPKFEDARGGIAYFNACDVAMVIETQPYRTLDVPREAVLKIEKNRQGLSGSAGILDLVLDNRRLEFYPLNREVDEKQRRDYL